jgi:hypothetical protein
MASQQGPQLGLERLRALGRVVGEEHRKPGKARIQG